MLSKNKSVREIQIPYDFTLVWNLRNKPTGKKIRERERERERERISSKLCTISAESDAEFDEGGGA